jgi:hypothetical protein
MEFEFDVIGWNWAQNPGKMEEGALLSLQCEPSNPYDSNAVMVFTSSSNEFIGRVPASNSASISKNITAGHNVFAKALSRRKARVMFTEKMTEKN